MRHRKRGRRLGRSASHRKAMMRNLASSLFLTERDEDYYSDLQQPDGRKVNPPSARGRVVTTLQKAKEVRPLVERCITIARKSLVHQEAAEELETDAERNSDEWKQWRTSDEYQQWNHAIAPAVAARRRCLRLLGDKEAVRILFDDIAPRFAQRDGGYTRVMRLAQPRLGDAGTRAILEFVGVHDRVVEKSEKPAFADDEETDETAAEESVDEETSETEDREEASVDEGAQAADQSDEAGGEEEEKKE